MTHPDEGRNPDQMVMGGATFEAPSMGALGTEGAGVIPLDHHPEGEQIILAQHISPTRAAIQRFRRHRLAVIGLIVVIVIVIMAIAAPLLTPWDPNRIDFKTGARQPPSALHPLGTDVAGRDVWARVLYGKAWILYGKNAKNKDAAKRLYKLACFGGLDEGCERLGAGPKNVNDHDDGHGH